MFGRLVELVVAVAEEEVRRRQLRHLDEGVLVLDDFLVSFDGLLPVLLGIGEIAVLELLDGLQCADGILAATRGHQTEPEHQGHGGCRGCAESDDHAVPFSRRTTMNKGASILTVHRAVNRQSPSDFRHRHP